MGTLLFLSVRVVHVLLGAIWFGAIVVMVLFVAPAVQQSGPAGGQVMGNLVRRGFTTFMPSIAGLTIVSGLWLYWRFTGGFTPSIVHSHAGLSFALGGASGLVALISADRG
jgi:putative copper export protein